uniref:Uncharacterized protein n=1 Tax=Romanomermis culicivorax TaxID=13658 RepID=A0A915IDU8_ROMCU
MDRYAVDGKASIGRVASLGNRGSTVGPELVGGVTPRTGGVTPRTGLVVITNYGWVCAVL